MKNLTLLLSALLLSAAAWGQQPGSIIKASSGDNLDNYVEKDAQYLLPEFTNGTVILKDNSISAGKLNYNQMIGEMQFVDPNTNAVLALANPKDVRIVTIGSRRFVPYKGREFVEILSGDGDGVCLAVYRKINVQPYGKEGAYGTVSPTTAISSYSTLEAQGTTTKLAANEYQIVSSKTSYLLLNKGKLTHIKNAKSFTKAYPSSHSASIESFVRSNSIDFSKKEDLVKLIEYCNQL